MSGQWILVLHFLGLLHIHYCRHKGQLMARSCKTRKTEEITSYYVIKGYQHQMSDDECGPGTITSSTSRSFQRGFAVQLGVFHVSKPPYLTV
jgi:hypothetical protein